MKRRILCMMLAIIMVVGLLPTTALAEGLIKPGKNVTADLSEDVTHIHCVCGKENCNDETHTQISYQPLPHVIDSCIRGGNYYLTGDTLLKKQLIQAQDGETINICLNGHALIFEDASNATGVINIFPSATLNLCDCNSEKLSHRFTPNEYGLWVLDEANGTNCIEGGVIVGNSVCTNNIVSVYSYGLFNMYGGTIVGFAGEEGSNSSVGVYPYSTFNMYSGGMVGNGKNYDNNDHYINDNAGASGIDVSNDAIANMYGGTISYNTCDDAGGVFNTGIFNMYGGTISYNEGYVGGVDNLGTFNMYGGTISNNLGTRDRFGNGIGGVYNSNIIRMTGGSIVNNVGETCGGLCKAYDSTVILSGTPVIFDNTNIQGKSRDLQLYFVTREEAYVLATLDGPLEDGALIGIESGDPSDRIGWSDVNAVFCGTEDYTVTASDAEKFIDNEAACYIEARPEENKIYAIYIFYMVTYDVNGGSYYFPWQVVQPAKVYIYDQASVPSNIESKLYRDGYTFEGWNSKPDGSGMDYYSWEYFTPTEDMTLYANWKKIPTYTVTYDANCSDYTGTLPATQEIPIGAYSPTYSVADSYGLERPGYEFAYWATAPYVDEWEFEKIFYTGARLNEITGDMVLYAQWREKPASVTLTLPVTIAIEGANAPVASFIVSGSGTMSPISDFRRTEGVGRYDATITVTLSPYENLDYLKTEGIRVWQSANSPSLNWNYDSTSFYFRFDGATETWKPYKRVSGQFVPVDEAVFTNVYTTPKPEWVELSVSNVRMEKGMYLANGASELTSTKPTSGGYAYFAEDGKTLVLYNYDNVGKGYAASGKNAIYSLLSELDIVLVGDNTISSCAQAIYSKGTLSITTANESSTLSSQTTYAFVKSTGDVTIADGAVITSSITNPYDTYFIRTSGNITVQDATLELTGSASGGLSVERIGNIIIRNSTVNLTTESVDILYGAISAQQGSITIEQSTVSTEKFSSGIAAQSAISIKNSDVTVDITTVNGSWSYPIESQNGQVTLENSTLLAGGSSSNPAIGNKYQLNLQLNYTGDNWSFKSANTKEELTERTQSEFVNRIKNPGDRWAQITGTVPEAVEAPYTLRYNANGGTGSVDSQTGNTLTVAAASGLQKGERSFIGWNTLPDGTGTFYQPDASITLTENVVLYAIWEGNAEQGGEEGGETGGEDPVTDPFTIKNIGRTLELESKILILQYVTLENLPEGADLSNDAGLLVFKSNPGENAVIENADAQNIKGMKACTIPGTTMQGYYMATEGIAAKEYADELWLRAYVTVNGTTYYSTLRQYSVQTYCNNILKGSYAENHKKVCASLLNYGAAAQLQFDYNTDDLANAGMTYTVPEWNESMVTDMVQPETDLVGDEGYAFLGKTLLTEGLISVKYYATAPEGVNITSARLQYWAGVSGKLTEENAVTIDATTETVNSQTAYVATGIGIAAKAYSDTVYARMVFTDNQGNTYATEVVPYSVEQYASNKLDDASSTLVALVKAMVVYGDCSKNYFNHH